MLYRRQGLRKQSCEVFMHKANETTVIFKAVLKKSKVKTDVVHSILEATTEHFGPHEQKRDP